MENIMSEEENLEIEQEEVETEEEIVTLSPVEELVNNITDGELNKAETSFQGLINDKITDALEAQKVAVADTIFNDRVAEPEVDPEMELDNDLLNDDEESTEEVPSEES
jgi:hypothetical protein